MPLLRAAPSPGNTGLHGLPEQRMRLEHQGWSHPCKTNMGLNTGLGQQVEVKHVIKCQNKGGLSPLLS